MRLREAPGPVFDPPPLELRRWTWCGTDPRPPGRLGAEAYRSRAAWLRARRRWESRRGQALGEWFAEARAEARAERGFDGWLEMRAYRPDPDKDPDEGWDPLRDEW